MTMILELGDLLNSGKCQGTVSLSCLDVKHSHRTVPVLPFGWWSQFSDNQVKKRCHHTQEGH